MALKQNTDWQRLYDADAGSLNLKSPQFKEFSEFRALSKKCLSIRHSNRYCSALFPFGLHLKNKFHLTLAIIFQI